MLALLYCLVMFPDLSLLSCQCLSCTGCIQGDPSSWPLRGLEHYMQADFKSTAGRCWSLHCSSTAMRDGAPAALLVVCPFLHGADSLCPSASGSLQGWGCTHTCTTSRALLGTVKYFFPFFSPGFSWGLFIYSSSSIVAISRACKHGSWS